MKEANEEIREFCQRNEWVNEIHQFCENWTENCVNQWEGEAAYAIEVHGSHFDPTGIIIVFRFCSKS